MTSSSASSSTDEKILSEYDTQLELHSAFTRCLESLIRELLAHEKIDVLTVEARTKERASLKEKIGRPEKSGKYDSLLAITDISGVRIISYLTDDCRSICDLIENELLVDWTNSSDKEENLDPDRFGYLSMHRVVQLPPQRTRLIEFSRFEGLRAEIQVRTVLQHAWAAIDWRLRYKSRHEAPPHIRRRLSRISAMLEAADEDFNTVANKATLIREEYRLAITRKNFQVTLDAESLSIYIQRSEELERWEMRLLRAGVDILRVPTETHGRLASLLYSLLHAKFVTIEEINDCGKGQVRVKTARLKSIYTAWMSSGEEFFEAWSVETMLRLLISVSVPKDRGILVINSAPMNPRLAAVALDELNKS